MTSNNVVRGSNDKPAASSSLAAFFESTPTIVDGELLVGYPIASAGDSHGPIDAVYVSPTLGIVVFDLVEGRDLGAYVDRQDAAFNRLEIRLKQHGALVSRRKLRVPLNAVTYAPGIPTAELSRLGGDADYPVANSESLEDVLQRLAWDAQDDDVFRQSVSALQAISSIRATPNSRPTTSEDSRGSKLKALEASIATLDNDQSKAVIETTNDVQRIRGLAGSGKTIVLALKAAYLHASNPEWKIAVTYNSRSLSDQFRRLINTFHIAQTQEEPDWTKVQVLNSWGSSGGVERSGVYRQFCIANGVPFYDFGSAKRRFGNSDAFGGACAEALKEAKDIQPTYDAILIDEAQDLPPSFMQMCYLMLGPTKRLVYAYDELQTLAGGGLPPVELLFGDDPDTRQPRVMFDPTDPEVDRRDIILQKCYRNSRPVLVTAHALGFGVYREPPANRTTGLVQIFDQKDLWEDIGYEVVDGALQDGYDVTLARTPNSSPLFLESHSDDDDLIQFIKFDNIVAQNTWLADQIEHNLRVDELLATDVIVINPDPYTTRNNLGPVMANLLDRGIASHIAGVDTSADVFFRRDEESVTFTGIYRAKGNEAGMVYVANAHEALTSTASLASVRNRLFTAITRSKAWVRVTGVGSEMDQLIAEYQKVKANRYRLAFRYPTEQERTTMQIVNRDLSRAEEQKVRRSDQALAQVLADLEAGDIFVEDIDPITRERLADLLARHAGGTPPST